MPCPRAVARAVTGVLAAALVTSGLAATAGPAAALDPLEVRVDSCRWSPRGHTFPLELAVTNHTGAPVTGVSVAPATALPTGFSAGALPAPATIGSGATHVFRLDVSIANGTATGDYDVPFAVAASAGGTTVDWLTKVTDAPGTPAAPTATAGDTTAYVTWPATTSNISGKPVTLYIVTAWPGGTTTVADYGATSATVRGLTNGTAYTFTVTAHNYEGETTGPPSAPVTPTGPPPADPPAGAPGPFTGTVTVTPGDFTFDVTLTGLDPAVPRYVLASPQLPQPVSLYPSGADHEWYAFGLSVTPGTSYTFTVTPVNDAGAGPTSAPTAPVMATAEPGIPVVEAMPRDGGAFVCLLGVWGRGLPVTSYVAEAYHNGQPTGHTWTLPPDTRVATLDGLTNGTAYDIRVRGVNAIGPGGDNYANGDPAYVTPAAAPAAPAGVTATAGDGTATVAWNPAVGNGYTVTGYTVTASPGGATRTVAGTSADFSGLANGTAYTFLVHATNALGDGPDSAPTNPVTPAGVPAQVTGAAAMAGDNTAHVIWSAPDPNGSPVTSYTVTASPGGATKTVTGTAADVGGLVGGTSYTFVVHATNAAGDGADSAPTNAVTPAGVPAQVADAATTAGDRSAHVTWSAPAANGYPITSYTVTASPGGAHVTVTGTSADLSGLTDGTAYTFAVHATNALGDGPDSAPTAPVTPAGVPAQVTGAIATAGDGSAHVTWSAAGGNGSPVTAYTVTASPGGATKTATGTSADVGGLAAGAEYTFVVHATNALGDGPDSAPTNAVIPTGVPGQVTGVTATGGDRIAHVTWSVPAANGYPITSYTVTASPGGAQVTLTGTSTSFSLTNGTAYTFAVHATNARGNGPDSAPTAPVTPAGVPAQVTGVTATAGNGTAHVTWPAPDANGSPITSYTVAAVGAGTVTVTGTSADFTGLTNGNWYAFNVRATNALGPGAVSELSNPVTPQAVPDQVTGVTATAGDGTAHVTWSAANGNGYPITGYTVTASPGGAHVTVTGTSTDVYGLANGTAYTFVVHASNAVGSGPDSAPTDAVTPVGLPGRVTDVTATAGNGSAHVTWSAADGNGFPVTSYTVTASPGGAHVTVTGTSADVDGLSNGMTYAFVVHATSALGDGPDSLPSNEVLLDGTAPAVTVDALPAFTLGATVGVTYGATDDSSGVATTAVRYRTAPYGGAFGPWRALATATVSAVRGYTYCFAVAATDVVGNTSAWSTDRCTAVPLDDRALHASASWSYTGSGAYYAGTMTSTTVKGATLTRRGVQARRLALVVTKCTGGATLGVYLDGVLVKQVATAASATAYRRVVPIDLGALRSGTVTVKVLTSGRAYVDGLGISRV